MNRNLCKTVLSQGGSIIPLLIDPQFSKGLGLMNPSILLDSTRILLNLRNINYTLYHCEGEQLFNNRWGPLSYLHPENDMHLRTYNFMCELDPESLEIKNYCLTDTKELDKDPLWEFVGLEDARLVRWDGKLYQCGVRRDTTTNGQGRMELSEIIERDSAELKEGECKWKEVSRNRIDPPGPPTYCEKNWMPILDMPYHFVKWCNPTQVVKVNLNTNKAENVYLAKSYIEGFNDFRGGSQVIKWKDYRIAMIHEVNLFKNKLQQKDATYTHRFIVWDKDWNIIKISDAFSMMDGEIEFGCGMMFYKKDLLLTFGFQDNAAYILRVPEHMIEEVLGFTKHKFDWGPLDKNNYTSDYQRHFKVEKDNIVVDVGADVGSFANIALKEYPKRIFCFEKDRALFPVLSKNTKNNFNIIPINREIKFNEFIKSYDIKEIDFLKINSDQIGDILEKDNFEWIKINVKKIVIKWNISNENRKILFKEFRDNYLSTLIEFYQIRSSENENIEKEIWDDEFIQNNNSILIYINNVPKQITESKIKIGFKDIKNNLPIEQDINEKWKVSKWPTLEITTNILEKGCPVDCLFCPQRVLSNAYKGESMLSLENFKKIIDKIPKEITIIFSGLSEPWLNKSATDMVLYAYEKGHQIAVFTTGIGMTIEDIDTLKTIKYPLGPKNPLIGSNGLPMLNGGFTLHLPDNEGYSKHKITKKYIEFLEYVNKIKSEIDGFRLTCMGTVHDDIKHIFPVSPKLDLWWRAGNLIKEEKLKPELKEFSNKYMNAKVVKEDSTCGCDEDLYHNVLLPNGDLILCCMDYNLDHVLGNLLEQEYNDILPIQNTPFELCKYCENKKVL